MATMAVLALCGPGSWAHSALAKQPGGHQFESYPNTACSMKAHDNQEAMA